MTNLIQSSRSNRYEVGHSYDVNQFWSMPVNNWRPNEEGITSDFVSLVQGAYKANAIVYACEMTRISLFSEARFQWRKMNDGRPGDLFNDAELSVLQRPWPGGVTGDLRAGSFESRDGC